MTNDRMTLSITRGVAACTGGTAVVSWFTLLCVDWPSRLDCVSRARMAS